MNLHNLRNYITNEKVVGVYVSYNNQTDKLIDIYDVKKIKGKYEIMAYIDIGDKEIEVLVDLNSGFPYNLPLLKINNLEVFDEYKDKYGVYPPHITPKGGICIADREQVVPNFENPNGVLAFSIEQAAGIIVDGYNEVNTSEFIDEFNVHLFNIAFKSSKNSNKIYLLSELCEEKSGSRLYLSTTEYPALYGLNLSTNEEINKQNFQIRSSLRNIIPTHKVNIESERVLYLHLIKPLKFPLPKTNKEIFDFIRDENKNIFKIYYEYLKKKEDKDCIVIFSMNDRQGKKVFFAIKHKKPIAKEKNRKFGYRFTDSKSDKLIYKSIYRLDQEIIESRIEGLTVVDKKVTIAGCGSVGSILTEGLLDIGVKDFYLIDDEPLKSENTIRHIGDMNDLGLNKVDVVKNHILNKKPYIDVIQINENIHSILNIKELYKYIFNERDINFFVTGNKSITNRVIDMINNDQLSNTIVLVWVEPYLYAGHFLILNKPIDFNKLYNSDYKFQFRVVDDKRDFIKQEAGCAGSYSIYSGFDTKRFVYDSLNYIKDNISDMDLHSKNILVTWTGNLMNARKEGIELSNAYVMEQGNFIKEVDLSQI